MYIKFLISLCLTLPVVYSSQDTGQPAGYMSDCPGMNKSTKFSAETRKSLTVVVHRPTTTSRFLEERQKTCKLDATCVAKFLNLKKRNTQVLISGYLDASFSPLIRMLVDTYISQGKNVIVLELFPVLVHTYPVAARITKPLGIQLGRFLAELTHLGLSPKKMELIGGSLGAHTAAYAAMKYRELTGYKPTRVTGLDPAGPCFRNMPATDRLHPDVADRVDVLHTNIDGFGIADALGHVDFYANGGEYQPSMIGNFILPCFLLCSHVRAAFYWMLAAKNPDKFVAVRCDSVESARSGDCFDGSLETNYLGPKINFTKPGVYYLPTNDIYPYWMGEDGLKKRNYGVNQYLSKAASDLDMVI